MYIIFLHGNTVSTKIYSTAKFYISISYQKDLLSIDTRIFTLSLKHNINPIRLHNFFRQFAGAHAQYLAVQAIGGHAHNTQIP